MREVFSDFMLLDDRPDGTVRVPLGAEASAADLTGLSDGESVLLVYPDNLRAPATVESEMHHGERFWYGIIPSRSAIVVLDVESADETQSASATPAHG